VVAVLRISRQRERTVGAAADADQDVEGELGYIHVVQPNPAAG